jgi:integrase
MMKKKAVFKRFYQYLNKKNFDQYSDISKITITLCFEYLQTQFTERSGYAANKDRKNLSASYSWIKKYIDYNIKDNPFEYIEKFPEIKTKKYVPPVKDFWKVYNTCNNQQDKLMLLTYLYTAGRRNEIFQLTWNDIDFDQNTISLNTRKRKQGNLEIDQIPLHDNLKNPLLQWKQDQPIKNDYVFICISINQIGKPHKQYGKPFKNRQHFMKQLCKKSDVKPFGFHAIRHLTATILYNNGSKLYVIQQILRHKSASTTEKYLHSLGLNKHLRDDFNNNMPEFFGD